MAISDLTLNQAIPGSLTSHQPSPDVTDHNHQRSTTRKAKTLNGLSNRIAVADLIDDTQDPPSFIPVRSIGKSQALADFIRVFGEFEETHIRLHAKLNALPVNMEGLRTILDSEMAAYDPWVVDVSDRLGEITADATSEQKQAYMQYIRQSRYFKIVQEAPFYWRIMNKPNGYPGDAHMMHYIYRNQYEGPTPFGMFLHKHACTTKACVAVRNRRQFLSRHIQKTGGGKIMSLAAGPAEEIKDVLSQTDGRNDYDFLALDHDMDTLQQFKNGKHQSQFKYALANAFQIIAGNYVTAKPRNLFHKYCSPAHDFRGYWRLLMSYVKYELKRLEKESFDLVYTAGLYDYIKNFPLDDDKGTVALTRNLFSLVKPGGSLIIGNFNHNNPRHLRFAMDYIFDWQLIYRDKEEMLAFAKSIPQDEIANIEVLEEAASINYFLKIDKA